MRSFATVPLAALLGLGLFASPHVPARAQSADLVLCDRIAADPADPDKPADVQGTSRVLRAVHSGRG